MDEEEVAREQRRREREARRAARRGETVAEPIAAAAPAASAVAAPVQVTYNSCLLEREGGWGGECGWSQALVSLLSAFLFPEWCERTQSPFFEA